MTTATGQGLSPAQRRRRLSLALLRAAVSTAVLVALYYLLPLDLVFDVPLWLPLVVGLLILVTVATFQVKRVAQSRHPALQAVEALAGTAPLFLLLFAATYFVMASQDPASFTADNLTRTDALYFTVTVFATVGFGDISAASQAARLMVTAQMILDLIVLGLGIRVFIGAVEEGRRRQETTTEDDS